MAYVHNKKNYNNERVNQEQTYKWEDIQDGGAPWKIYSAVYLDKNV